VDQEFLMERQLFAILELRSIDAPCRRRANDRRARILAQRFEDRATLQTIATEQGVSRERIRQIETIGIRMLARPLRIDHLQTILPAEHRLMQAVEAQRRELEFYAQLAERKGI
jgi:DNA-directed RNA polymerase sigma subunit (sigma70/sigma32)